jgi:hypothetical protein
MLPMRHVFLRWKTACELVDSFANRNRNDDCLWIDSWKALSVEEGDDDNIMKETRLAVPVAVHNCVSPKKQSRRSIGATAEKTVRDRLSIANHLRLKITDPLLVLAIFWLCVTPTQSWIDDQALWNSRRCLDDVVGLFLQCCFMM